MSRWRRIAVVTALLGCGALATLAAPHLTGALDMALGLRALAQEAMPDGLRLLGVLALYAVLIAIPFVPAAEIGLLLLMLFGATMAGPVYAATVSGLLLSFSVGRLTPRPALRRLLAPLSLAGVLDTADRMASPQAPPAPGLLGRLLRWRCCALIALINTPGNTLLGGGGGIAMAAGLSGLFGFRAFLASVLIGVAPVPALFALTTLWT